MIVKCEQCNSKFKIPDEKVTAKGVKVKCAKCAHTFRVNHQGIVPEPGKEKTVVGPPPTAAPQTTVRIEPPPERFIDDVNSGQQTALNPIYAQPTAEVKPPPLQEFDPFAAFGGEALGAGPDAPTRQASFTSASDAVRAVPKPPTVTVAPFDFSGLVAPAPSVPTAPNADVTPFDFGSLVPSAPRPVPAQSANPFDFSALSGGAPVPSPSYAPAPAAGPASAFSFTHDPPPPSAVPSAPTVGRPTLPAAVDLSMLAQAMPSAPPVAAAKPAPPPAQVDFGDTGSFPNPVPFSSSLDFSGGAPASAPSAPDPFAAGPSAASQSAPSADVSRFDDGPPMGNAFSTGAEEEFPGRAPPPSNQKEVVRIHRPGEDKPLNDPEVSVAASSRRTALGVAVNAGLALAIAVLLLLVGSSLVNDGRVDSRTFSWERVSSLFSPASPYVASDISNGLYDTRAGRPIFYVRGFVENRSGGEAPLKVKAEILDGDSLIRSAEGFAGAAPTPEELFKVSAPEDLKALQDRLGVRASGIAPTTSAAFVIPFFEYPPDLKAFRVRVTVAPVADPQASR